MITATHVFWLLPVISLTALVISFVLEEDCPREAAGYECRGKRCDHGSKK